MTVYGITRASTRKQQASPEVQAKMIREQCAAAQLPEPVKEGKGTGNGFEWYWRATRWFHRMKHAGKLPPPYCDTAHTIPETKLFTVEKRRKRPNAKPVIDEKAAWTAEQWREWFGVECVGN